MPDGIKDYRAKDGGLLWGQSVSLIQLLGEFRQQLEHDAEEPIENLGLNIALLLSDLCCF